MAHSAIMSVRITGNADDAVKAFEKTTTKAAAFGSAIGGLATKGLTALWDKVKGFAGDVVDMSDSTDKFMKTMSFAGIDDSAVRKATKAARKYADDTVYDLGDIQNTTAQLAANGIGNYTELTEAAGNLNAVAGGNADTFKSVAMMLTQTAGAGKLTTENWNQLTDAIPGASGKLQEALLKNGAYTGNFRDAMAKGEITADEFNKALLDLGMTDIAKQAATSTETFEGAMGNLEAAVVGGLNDMLAYVKPSITGGINFVTGKIEGGFTWTRNAIDGLVNFIRTGDINDAFATAFGSDAWSNDVINAVVKVRQDVIGFASSVRSKLTDARKGVVDFFQGFMSTGPVDTAVNALMSLWNAIGTVGGSVGDFIKALMDACAPLNPLAGEANGAATAGTMLGNAFQAAGSAVSTASGFISTAAGYLTMISDWVGANGDLVTTVLVGIGAGFAAFKVASLITAVVTALQGFSIASTAAAAAQWALNIAANANPLMLLVTAIAAVVAALAWFFTKTQTGRGIWQSFTSFILNCVNNIKSFFSGLGSTIIGIFTSAANGARNAWNGVVGWFRGLPGSIAGFFGNAGSILYNAGASIINGFLNGLKAKWDSVTGWISGIGDWISAHKGPISYDRRLLIPHGKAIMTGFAQGLNNGFDNSVQTAIGRANRRLAAMPLTLSTQGQGSGPTIVNTWNVEINGEVIDKDGTAKAIKRLLADYDARRS